MSCSSSPLSNHHRLLFTTPPRVKYEADEISSDTPTPLKNALNSIRKTSFLSPPKLEDLAEICAADSSLFETPSKALTSSECSYIFDMDTENEFFESFSNHQQHQTPKSSRHQQQQQNNNKRKSSAKRISFSPLKNLNIINEIKTERSNDNLFDDDLFL
jgi:hypothetical protein